MKHSIEQLLELMARLRHPTDGCPWDRAQTYRTIVPYTLEEAYEVADAISREDYGELKGELGDLLFQVVFYAQIAKEENRFDFEDVIQGIVSKMIARHPHVFADEEIGSADEQTLRWEEHKVRERRDEKHRNGSPIATEESIVDHITRTLPALTQAKKIQSRLARVGFDWERDDEVFAKIFEEIDELRQGIANNDKANIEEEVGDLLFMCVNIARRLGVDPEYALHQANAKFSNRIRFMERELRESGREFQSTSLADLECLWEKSKLDPDY